MEKFLSVKEVAEKLSVTTKTIQRYIKAGKIEAVKMGNRWKIPEQALDEFIRAGGTFVEYKKHI